MDKLTAIKIKYDDGTYSDEIPVSVLSENVEWDSTHTLVDVLGSIDVDVTGTIQDQISQLFNEKVSNSDMQSYISSSMPTYITTWLNTNVNPVGSAVVVDKSLTISGAAADAKETGDGINGLKNALININSHLSDGAPSLLVFDWTHGQNWKHDNKILVAEMNYRVCNSEPFTYPVDLRLVHPDFFIELYMDTNHDGTFATHVPWYIDPYTIPANTPTYIGIRRMSEDTTEIANISEFVNALNIPSILAKEAELQNIKNLIISSKVLPAIADNVESGKYIDINGVVRNLAKYTIYDFNLNKNDILIIKTTNGISDANNIAFISVWKNGNFEYQFGISIDNVPTIDHFIASENCVVRVVTRNNNTTYKYDFKKAMFAEGIISYIDNFISDATIKSNTQILSAFKNLTCIGDSLTFSQVYISSSSSRQAFNPYPKVIENLTGVSATILAVAGYTTIDSWTRYKDEIIQKDGQLAIIYLGTNGGLTDTINEDMIGNDYTQWSDTNTGCYGKLIAKLLSVNSRVILIKVHSTTGNLTTTNNVIEAMGNKFNVPVIDNTYLVGSKYHSYPDGSGSNGTHYNDFGYTVFAQQVINKISHLSDTDILKILPI